MHFGVRGTATLQWHGPAAVPRAAPPPRYPPRHAGRYIKEHEDYEVEILVTSCFARAEPQKQAKVCLRVFLFLGVVFLDGEALWQRRGNCVFKTNNSLRWASNHSRPGQVRGAREKKMMRKLSECASP